MFMLYLLMLFILECSDRLSWNDKMERQLYGFGTASFSVHTFADI